MPSQGLRGLVGQGMGATKDSAKRSIAWVAGSSSGSLPSVTFACTADAYLIGGGGGRGNSNGAGGGGAASQVRFMYGPGMIGTYVRGAGGGDSMAGAATTLTVNGALIGQANGGSPGSGGNGGAGGAGGIGRTLRRGGAGGDTVSDGTAGEYGAIGGTTTGVVGGGGGSAGFSDLIGGGLAGVGGSAAGSGSLPGGGSGGGSPAVGADGLLLIVFREI